MKPFKYLILVSVLFCGSQVAAQSELENLQVVCAVDTTEIPESPVSFRSGPGAQLYFPNRDSVNVLLVFVQHLDDEFEHCNDLEAPGGPTDVPYQGNCSTGLPRYESWTDDPVTEWPAFHSRGPDRALPLWAQSEFIDPPGTPVSSFTEGSLSDYYHTMSGGRFDMRGYVYPEVYIPDHEGEWYADNWGTFPNGLIALSHEILNAIDPASFGIVLDSKFDRQENGTNNIGQPEDADNQFDMVVLVYRLNKLHQVAGGTDYANHPGATAVSSLGSPSNQSFGYDGFASSPVFLGPNDLQVTDNIRYGGGVLSIGYTRGLAIQITAHEIGHRQFGYYHESGVTLSNSLGTMNAGSLPTMSGSDRLKLEWATVDTLDVSTGDRFSYSMDDTFVDDMLLYIMDGAPSTGDVVVEARTHSNFWDRPPDGINADGDGIDYYVPREGLYLYKRSGGGGRYVSMDNTGAQFRTKELRDGLRVAFEPGDAYSPFSKFRHKSVSGVPGNFNFYIQPTLDSRMAITDITSSGPTSFDFEVWSDYLSEASFGAKTLSSNYMLEADSTLARQDSWNLGGTFRFEDGFVATVGNEFHLDEDARLELAGGDVNVVGSSAAPIVFDRLDPLKAWDRIYVGGAGSTLKYVDIDGAAVGVEVSTLSVTIDNATLTNNGIGVLSDYVDGTPLQPERSRLTLANSTISNSGITGFHARHVDATVRTTTITTSGFSGVLVEDADLYPFNDNTITSNGTLTGNGISVISGGDVAMVANKFYFGGNNDVIDNSNHELSVSTGGTIFVGASSVSNDNEVYKSGGVGNPFARYIYNGALGFSVTVMAENTWWGDENGPPAGAFTGPVDYVPYLTCDPDDVCDPLGPGASSSARSGSGASSPRGRDWHTWLRGEILAARQALNDRPGAEGMAGVVHRLAHLQRLDREDEVGEHGATWALLRALRQRLNGHPPEAVREVAIAALVSEVRAGLYEQDYDAARDLLAQYASEVTDEESRLVLDLASVSLLEQAGDYASALAEITTIIAALRPEASDLARELGQAAAVIEARAEQQAGGRMPAPASAVASALGETVTTYALEAAYPNPFNPSVTIPFAVPEAAHVEVVLYDVLGRRVAVLANSLFDSGRHTIRLDGSGLASGVYVLRAMMEPEAGGSARAFTQQLTLLK